MALLMITGAADGMGAAVAKAALAQGHELILCDINAEALQQRWQAHVGVETAVLDVRDRKQWRALCARFSEAGRIPDVLINIAGILRSGAVAELASEDVELQLDVNVKGLIWGTDALGALMAERGSGHIINFGSIAALYATPGAAVYSASKFAVRAFSIAAAGDLAQHGVAVSMVGPGPVKTGMLERERGNKDAALIFSRNRALEAEEVAAAVLGPVLTKRPLEYYLPKKEGWLGKLALIFPSLLLRQVESLRTKGLRNFDSNAFK